MSLILKISSFVMLSVGWRRHLISFFSGAIGALAMSPLDVFPALCIPMSVAVWLIDGSFHGKSSTKSWWFSVGSAGVSIDGWWMGFGYFLAGLWWLGAAFFIEADKFGILAPVAVLGLPAILGLFFSAGFFLARLFWSENSWRCLSLAIGLGVCEWFRSVAFTGFPWNNLGMALAGNLNLAQVGSLIGLHGMTFVAIFLAAAPASMTDIGRRKKIVAPSLALLLFLCLFAGGAIRLTLAISSFEPDVNLRIVQPNIEQGTKFVPSAMDKILKKHVDLSLGAAEGSRKSADLVSHFIWPESPFPIPLSMAPAALSQIAASLPASSMLFTGAIRPEFQSSGQRLFYNSIHAISSAGEIAANYDKQHLVPFGEYLPLSSFLERIGLQQFVHVPGGFSAGDGSKVLRIAGLPPIEALICYEAIFSRTSYTGISERPGLILNVTNDAWFGQTPGPHQHFSQARLRAIEEGLPLVRAANSGISAIVDPYGRVLNSLPLGAEGIVDGPLPSPLPATVFAHYPLGAPAFVLLLMALALLFANRRKFR